MSRGAPARLCGAALLAAMVACAGGPSEPGRSDLVEDEVASSGGAPAGVEGGRRQLGGVRMAVAERRGIGGPLELPAVVAVDDDRLRPVQLRLSGWVERLSVSGIGDAVRAGDPLLTLTSPQLLEAELAYLIELAARGPVRPESHAREEPHGAAARLRELEVPEAEIRRLRLDRRAAPSFTARAPVGGVVIGCDVAVGQFAPAGTTLLTLVELSGIRVLADLDGREAARVRVGDGATFTPEAAPGREYRGRIESIAPALSPVTRTFQVRMSLEVSDGALRPGMFGRVRVAGRYDSSLTVPGEAVLHAGESCYVFLVRRDGGVEPRIVATGAADEDRIEILRGLAPGDTVVARAAFLIDSESRREAAIIGMGR